MYGRISLRAGEAYCGQVNKIGQWDFLYAVQRLLSMTFLQEEVLKWSRLLQMLLEDSYCDSSMATF